MPTISSTLGRALTLATALAAPAAAQQYPALAIEHVNVVDVSGGRVLPDQTVVIDQGQIRSVVPAARWRDTAAATLDGGGRFLIPGLWDMHAHLRSNGLPAAITTDWMMPLLIANGVTGIREMTSDCESPSQGPVCLEQMRSWQAEIADGRLLGPRFLALSSFKLDPPWDFVMTEEQARGAVAMLADRGVDFLKIYNRLSPQALAWIADEARRRGIRIAGHVPVRVTAEEASNEGFWSIEHARDLLIDCYPGAATYRRTARAVTPSTAEMRAMVDQHDPARCAGIFHTLVANGTGYVPTHVTRRMEAMADDSAFRHDPRNRYLPAPMLQSWNRDADRMVALDSSAAGRRAFEDFYRAGLAITGQAYRAGVTVLVGTDAGDSFVYPGSAVHDELGELVKAGLSPVEALRAATLVPARFMGLEEHHGTVAAGRRADLILLDGNPLVDIGNVRRIRAVVFRGEVFGRDRLDSLLEAAAGVAARFGQP